VNVIATRQLGSFEDRISEKRFRAHERQSSRLGSYTSTAIGVDSGLIRRGQGRFVADMGIGILSSAQDFLQKYDAALDPVLKRNRIERRERLLNLYVLKNSLGPARARQVVRDFLRNIIGEVAEVVFCYSTFPTRKIPYTWIYTEDPQRKKVGILKFVQMIQAGYALFVAHHYKESAKGSGAVMLDHFDFPITRAWRELEPHSDLGVYVRGDLCNPRISIADLLLDLVECDIWRLNRTNAFDTIGKLCPGASVRVSCLTDIEVMRPLTRTQTDLSRRIAHPIIFLVKEDLPGEGKVLESSPLMFAARNMACELGGCAKVFEPGPTDQRLIGKGDCFVHKGRVSKGVVKALETSGYDIMSWNQHDLLSKYSL